MLRGLRRRRASRSASFDVAVGTRRSRLDSADAIAELLGQPLERTRTESRAGDGKKRCG